jgi:hypothetical protein
MWVGEGDKKVTWCLGVQLDRCVTGGHKCRILVLQVGGFANDDNDDYASNIYIINVF